VLLAGLFKFLTVISGIAAVVCLIGLTDTTHQVFGSDVGAALAVALILFVLSGIAWTLAGRSEQTPGADKSTNALPVLTNGAGLQVDTGSGMPVSAEEAAGVLRSWRDENRRIRFHTYQVPEEAIDYLCSGMGRIEELTSFIVRLSDPNGNGVVRGDVQGCIVSLRRATGFVLWDWRNVPPAEEAMRKSLREGYDVSLTVEFRSGARCELQAAKLGSESKIPG